VAARVAGPARPGHLSSFPSSSEVCQDPGQDPLSFTKVRGIFPAAEGRRQEPNTSLGEKESRPVLWKVVTSFGEEFKPFARNRTCPVGCGGAPARPVPSPAGGQAQAHPLPCGSSAPGQLRGRDLGDDIEHTPACCGQFMVHRRLGSRGWSLGR